MAGHFEQTFPINYGIDWSKSKLTLPERKAAETELLDAVIGLAKAFGGSDGNTRGPWTPCQSCYSGR